MKVNITFEEAKEYQTNLSAEIKNFRKSTKPQSPEKKRGKEIILENMYNIFLSVEKKLLTFLKAKYFQ